MQLMTKAIERRLPAMGSTHGMKPEAVEIVVKFFTPWSRWSWYATEGERLDDGDWLFFGFVDGNEPEFGQWRLSDLTGVTGPAGLKIERDRYFKGNLADAIPLNVHL